MPRISPLILQALDLGVSQQDREMIPLRPLKLKENVRMGSFIPAEQIPETKGCGHHIILFL